MFGCFSQAKQRKPALSEKQQNKTLDKALDPRGGGARRRALVAAKSPPINDLPKELLVSIFIAIENLSYVRHIIPCVCKEWREIYRSRDASPLHKTLEVKFGKEVEIAATRWGLGSRGLRAVASAIGQWPSQRWILNIPVVHGSRVVSWAQRRAGWVRELHLRGGFGGALQDFSSRDLGALVAAVAGSSLTELRIGCDFDKLIKKTFWDSMRDSVVPFGRLRSLVVQGVCSEVFGSDVAHLARLEGSLEELVLDTRFVDDREPSRPGVGLWRFPEPLCALTKLRRLELVGHKQITALPTQISSLKKLKELTLVCCGLASLPKELGELLGLTKLNLGANEKLGNETVDDDDDDDDDEDEDDEDAPQAPALPAQLRKMKSLRELHLFGCSLRAVPEFVGGLKSLEILNLSDNDLQIDTTLDFLIEGCASLRDVRLFKGGHPPWTPESLAYVEAFKTKLLARNPSAKVIYE